MGKLHSWQPTNCSPLALSPTCSPQVLQMGTPDSIFVASLAPLPWNPNCPNHSCSILIWVSFYMKASTILKDMQHGCLRECHTGGFVMLKRSRWWWLVGYGGCGVSGVVLLGEGEIGSNLYIYYYFARKDFENFAGTWRKALPTQLLYTRRRNMYRNVEVQYYLLIQLARPNWRYKSKTSNKRMPVATQLDLSLGRIRRKLTFLFRLMVKMQKIPVAARMPFLKIARASLRS